MKMTAAAAIAAMLFSATAHADSNVAYLADVASFGAGIGDSAGAMWGGGVARLDSVTDGAFNPVGQQWNFDSVYWSGTDTGLTITLAHTALVNRLVLEADTGDNYRIEFLDRANVWQSATTVNTDQFPAGQNLFGGPLLTPVLAKAFRITATGDNHYAVAEFQAYGDLVANDPPPPEDPSFPTAPVPEPSSWLMMAAGLALLAARYRQCAYLAIARR